MNASLRSEAPAGGLRERDPKPLRLSRRQLAVTAVLVAIAAIGGYYTISAIVAGPDSFPATVTSSDLFNLNFQSTGSVDAIDVRVGQRVKAGQVMATQEPGNLQNEITAQQKVVDADQVALAAAQAPSLTATQLQQDELQIQQAQTALTDATNALAATRSVGTATTANAQKALDTANQLATIDQQQYQQACPNGTAPPPPTLTGPSLQSGLDAYYHCQTLESQLSRDSAAAAQAQAQLAVVDAQTQAAINSAQSAVNNAQTTVTLAQYQ
ncbi:MAG: hypothetical protein JO337_00310, partial [Acidimicrobiales bacterium]|nr:hypothetical protein [Acidimicrobiales bacterium]